MKVRFILLIVVATFMSLALLSCGSKSPTEPNEVELSCANLNLAPDSMRVDVGTPAFSNPTSVTNPLFPVSAQSRVLLMGNVDGAPFRVEVTLLPGTRLITWNGNAVETLVSQYVAFLGGRIHEVALDWYAQADDGAVWYFGEDVFNYEDGRISDTDGTWLAGLDGPPGMIMAGVPQVGDVWRPENICESVFEEVTVQSVGVTVNGPQGPINGAIIVRELHLDGTQESKTFAPAYGEFSTGSGTNLEAVALALPTDALAGPMPAELNTLWTGAAQVFDAAGSGAWSTASASVTAVNAAWATFQTGSLPPMLLAQMNEARGRLVSAVNATQVANARQASIDVARATLDFQQRHRPRAEVDTDLIELWIRQLLVDEAANDEGAVMGDVVAIKWTRDRLTSSEAAPIEADVRAVLAAVEARDPVATKAAAARLRRTLAR
ncbi:MAG: hypothetical protein HOP12_14550 [Candidatus Eisenbacteria bacterium]|uniref:Uncharacterized protein n=1 Tax=Eiseniibacteriota bacterium TaxID=2212470 RepID=A0A849SLQ0_UNCEI|nr:hypothetical protein [Candidatus Eisenbacteria bacterium]